MRHSARIPAPGLNPSRKRLHRGRILRSAASAAVLAVGLPLGAQRATVTVQQTGAPAAAPRADDKRAMTVADYAKWRSIRDVAISDDGTWASYAYQQRRVDDTLYIENLTAKAEWKLPRASRVQFSDDSKWVAYFVAEPTRANAPETETPANGPARLELRNLMNAVGQSQSWDIWIQPSSACASARSGARDSAYATASRARRYPSTTGAQPLSACAAYASASSVHARANSGSRSKARFR